METLHRTNNDFIQLLTDALAGEFRGPEEPTNEVEPGEMVIGEITDPVGQALYKLHAHTGQKYHDRSRELIKPPVVTGIHDLISMMAQGGPGANLSIDENIELTTLKSESDAALHIFRSFLYSRFPKTLDPRVNDAIRKGWQVVIFKGR